MRTALTIAASDPCGGAGIQADLRVFTSQGVAGLSAITALTVQDTTGVRSIHPVEPGVIADQIEVLLADTGCHVVKIGMAPNSQAVAAIARSLHVARPLQIVLDPVLTSTEGKGFLDTKGSRTLLNEIVPLCSLITPNIPETEALLGRAARTFSEREEAAHQFIQMGAQAVLIKGGHLEGDPEDLLITADGTLRRLSGPRIPTHHTHGTGCFLSSAIAARLACGDPVVRAVMTAHQLLRNGLRHPITVGAGRGSPNPFADALLFGDGRSHQDRMGLLTGIYVLTDTDLQKGRSNEELVRQALAGGANVVQLRNKTATTPDLIRSAQKLSEICQAAHALFIVNDRVDVAAICGADGVHLGPDDMLPEQARQILGWDKVIGVSVGTVAEAIKNAPWASYMAVGAIFGSTTKTNAGPPVGPDRIRSIREAVPGIPLVAIGGIHKDNIGSVAAAGAVSAAVISAILQAPDITAAVKDMGERFRKYLTGRNPVL